MDYKYDAFISYRHAEKDTRIASEIQKSLERFKIPAYLRKKTGKQRFNRVFRDVEELPISSNLTEDLTEALRASQYLIVICSYRTSESDWVKREIDTFLELHDYNKQLVLTVLVEGEPDEVIPEVLRHDNITHYLADGSFYCRDEVVEPLAADYRMPIAKARKTELPRLAASMLGCNYDDIIRRRKAYKRTRLLIETLVISAAAIALLAYIGWMLMRIQNGLKNAQMNQSRYLASESQKLLEEGDRIGAIQLALAALEDPDGTRRPVTSEAQYVLSSALGSYMTKGQANSQDKETMYSFPTWKYETTSPVVNFACSSAADRVAILDSTGKLFVWKIEDHSLEKVLSDEESKFLDFCFDKRDNLIVVSTNNVALYNAKTWEKVWERNPGNLISAQKHLFDYYSSFDLIILNNYSSLIVFNTEDGAVKTTIPLDKDMRTQKKTGTITFSIENFAFNYDMSKVSVTGNSGSVNNYALYEYDLKAKKWTCLEDTSGIYYRINYDSDGNLITMRRPPDDTNASYYDSSNMIHESSVIVEMIAPDGKPVWSRSYPSLTGITYTRTKNVTVKSKDGKETPVICAVYGNRFVFIDKKNGDPLKSYDLPESVIATGFGDTNATVVQRNGTVIWFKLDPAAGDAQGYKYFMDGIQNMISFNDEEKNTYYLALDSSKRIVTEYSPNFADPDYKPFDGTESLGLVKEQIKCGKYLLTYATDKRVSCTDLEQNKVIWTSDVINETVHFVAGSDVDKKNVFITKLLKDAEGDLKCKLVKVSCEDGQMVNCNDKFSASQTAEVIVRHGKIWSYVYDIGSKNVTIYSLNMADDSVEQIPVNAEDFEFDYFAGELSVSPNGKTAFLYYQSNAQGQENYIRVTVDCDKKEYTHKDSGSCLNAVWNDDGSLFAEASSSGIINVCSAKGDLMYKIDTEQRIPVGMTFYGKKLYVIYTVNVMCCYDQQGNQISSIKLNNGDLNTVSTAQFEFTPTYLFVTVGGFTNIVNLSDNKSIAAFSGFMCVYSSKDNDPNLREAVVCCKTITNKYGSTMGYYQFKTPGRLIERAKEYLKGVTMSEEFKQKYALG